MIFQGKIITKLDSQCIGPRTNRQETMVVASKYKGKIADFPRNQFSEFLHGVPNASYAQMDDMFFSTAHGCSMSASFGNLEPSGGFSTHRNRCFHGKTLTKPGQKAAGRSFPSTTHASIRHSHHLPKLPKLSAETASCRNTMIS